MLDDATVRAHIEARLRPWVAAHGGRELTDAECQEAVALIRATLMEIADRYVDQEAAAAGPAMRNVILSARGAVRQSVTAVADKIGEEWLAEIRRRKAIEGEIAADFEGAI